MNEQILIKIDGRILVLLISLVFIGSTLIIKTLNIWLKNFEYRKRLGIEEEKKPENFLSWFAFKIIDMPAFRAILISFSIPLVALFLWIKYPGACLIVIKEHFAKQYKSAKAFVLNQKGK